MVLLNLISVWINFSNRYDILSISDDEKKKQLKTTKKAQIQDHSLTFYFILLLHLSDKFCCNLADGNERQLLLLFRHK